MGRTPLATLTTAELITHAYSTVSPDNILALELLDRLEHLWEETRYGGNPEFYRSDDRDDDA